MAALSSTDRYHLHLGSIDPVPSISSRSKAYLIYITSSSVMPFLSYVFVLNTVAFVTFTADVLRIDALD